MISTLVFWIVLAAAAVAVLAVIAALSAAGVLILAAPVALVFSALWWIIKLCLRLGVLAAAVWLIWALCRGLFRRA